MTSLFQPPPPQPNMGGAQPDSGRVGTPGALDIFANPPFSTSAHNPAVLAAILTAWIPPDPLPTQGDIPHKRASGTAAYTPNAYRPVVSEIVLAAWTPPDPAPTQSKARVTPGVVYTTPLANSLAPQITALAAWVPPDPPPQRRVPETVLTAPYTATGPWSTLFDGTFGPSILAPSSATESSVATLATILSVWALTDPAPQRALPHVVKGAPVPAMSTFGGDPWLPAVLGAWTPADPLPTLTAKLPQGAVYARPLQTLNIWLYNVLLAWAQPDPLPTLGSKLVQGLTNTAPVAYSPVVNEIVLTAWQPPDPLPTLPARTPQGAGPTTSLPYAPAWFSAVETAWQPPDPLPTLPARTPQGVGLGKTTYAPAWLSAVETAWQPPDPLPTLGKQFVWPTRPSTDVFVTTNTLTAVLQAWVPPDPLPTLPTHLPQGTVGGRAPVSFTWQVNTAFSFRALARPRRRSIVAYGSAPLRPPGSRPTRCRPSRHTSFRARRSEPILTSRALGSSTFTKLGFPPTRCLR